MDFSSKIVTTYVEFIISVEVKLMSTVAQKPGELEVYTLLSFLGMNNITSSNTMIC